jgi:hypothetical protein
MKIKVILIIFLLVLPLISSVEVQVNEVYEKGETLLVKVSGNFVDPILKENVIFYEEHVRVPMNFEVLKIDEEFYIYAMLPEIEKNYSIKIEEVEYYKGSQIIDDEIVMDFYVGNSTADFSVDKGAVITNEDFYLEVQNLLDKKIIVSSKFNEDEKFYELKSGEIKKLNFEIDEEELITLELSSENQKYEIPVYVYSNGSRDDSLNGRWGFEGSELVVNISTESEQTRMIYLYNNWGDLEDVELSVSDSLKDYLNLSVYEIDELEEGDNIKIELYFAASDIERSLEGQIKVKANESYDYMAVFLSYIKNYIPSEEELEDVVKKSETCDEMKGNKCDSEKETCDGTIDYAKDGVCCLGECVKKKVSSTGKYLGWGMVIVIVLALLWFFKFKYRGAY